MKRCRKFKVVKTIGNVIKKGTIVPFLLKHLISYIAVALTKGGTTLSSIALNRSIFPGNLKDK